MHFLSNVKMILISILLAMVVLVDFRMALLSTVVDGVFVLAIIGIYFLIPNKE